jgi:hypothetical protein
MQIFFLPAGKTSASKASVRWKHPTPQQPPLGLESLQVFTDLRANSATGETSAIRPYWIAYDVLALQGRLRSKRSLPSEHGPRQGAKGKSFSPVFRWKDCTKAPGAVEGGRRPKKSELVAPEKELIILNSIN